nr:MAG TPA: hypothetical protein [Caudoviricetes sp.]
MSYKPHFYIFSRPFSWQFQKYFLSLQLSKQPMRLSINEGRDDIQAPTLLERWAFFMAHIAR